jgi:hypothetical protein
VRIQMTIEKLSFLDLMQEFDEELSGASQRAPQGNTEDELLRDLPLSDAVDNEILMHRDSHFGGKFSIMLDYYESEGKGTDPEIKLSRIHQLMEMEQQLGKNLAPAMLTGPEAEEVGRAREAYKQLRSIYEIENLQSPIPRLISDLILTEDEEAEKEVDAVVQAGPDIVPSLISLLMKDEYLNPLFPGYGFAPILAAECLGKIGDESSIRSLFEVIGKDSEEIEMAAIDALRNIGDPAKTFLIQVLEGRPFTADNRNAGMALGLGFIGDEEVASTCFEQLKVWEGEENQTFLGFLVLSCVGLQSELRDSFKVWAESRPFSSDLSFEFEAVFSDWKGE